MWGGYNKKLRSNYHIRGRSSHAYGEIPEFCPLRSQNSREQIGAGIERGGSAAVRHGEREERGGKGGEDNAADDFCASYAGFFHGGLLFVRYK